MGVVFWWRELCSDVVRQAKCVVNPEEEDRHQLLLSRGVFEIASVVIFGTLNFPVLFFNKTEKCVHLTTTAGLSCQRGHQGRRIQISVGSPQF